MDTRDRSGIPGGGAFKPGETRTFSIRGACGVPASARAYSLNFTAVSNSALGYLTTWPANQIRPVVSTLNSPLGGVVANAAIVPGDASGAINIYVTDPTDIVVDINGYFAPSGTGSLSFYNLPPCRFADTREPLGPYGTPMLIGNNPRGFATAARCLIASTVGALSLNATVVPRGLLGYLTLWPDITQQPPLVSTLNAIDGAISSNAALVPTRNGSFAAVASHNTDLILDVSGYFGP